MATHRPTEYRYTYEGDPTVAAAYLPQGKTLLRLLQQKAGFNDLSTKKIIRRFGDVVVTATKHFNLYHLHIVATTTAVQIYCRYRGFLATIASYGRAYVPSYNYASHSLVDDVAVQAPYFSWYGINDRVLSWATYNDRYFEELDVGAPGEIYYRGCLYVTVPYSGFRNAAVFAGRLVITAGRYMYHTDFRDKPYGLEEAVWTQINPSSIGTLDDYPAIVSPDGSKWYFHFPSTPNYYRVLITLTYDNGLITHTFDDSETIDSPYSNFSGSPINPDPVITNQETYSDRTIIDNSYYLGYYLDYTLELGSGDCGGGTPNKILAATFSSTMVVPSDWVPPEPAANVARLPYILRVVDISFGARRRGGEGCSTATDSMDWYYVYDDISLKSDADYVEVDSMVLLKDFDPQTGNVLTLVVHPSTGTTSYIEKIVTTTEETSSVSRVDTDNGSTVIANHQASRDTTTGTCVSWGGGLNATSSINPEFYGGEQYTTVTYNSEGTRTQHTQRYDQLGWTGYATLCGRPIQIFEDNTLTATVSSVTTETFTFSDTDNFSVAYPGIANHGVPEAACYDAQYGTYSAAGSSSPSIDVTDATCRMFLYVDLRAKSALMAETIISGPPTAYVTRIYWDTPDGEVNVITKPVGFLISTGSFQGSGPGAAILYGRAPQIYESGVLTAIEAKIVYNGDDALLWCKGTLGGEDFEHIASIDTVAGNTIDAISLDNEHTITDLGAF